MVPIYIPLDVAKVTDAQKWMKENGIKHFPTVKVEGGHIYCLKNEEDAMAFKLAWR